jgi:hypothetical protein
MPIAGDKKTRQAQELVSEMKTLVLPAGSGRVSCSVLRALSTSSKSLQPVIDAVLADGGDIDERGQRNGRTALHFAASGGSLFNVRALVASGAQPDLPVLSDTNRGYSALMLACASAGRSLVVEYLLSSGADPDVVSASGETALSVALVCGRLTYDTLQRLRSVTSANGVLRARPSIADSGDVWNSQLLAQTQLFSPRSLSAGALVEVEGIVVSKRQVSKALAFCNLIPIGAPLPTHPMHWFVWEGTASDDVTPPCALQVRGNSRRSSGSNVQLCA